VKENKRTNEHEDECPTCLGEHDEGIHAATTDIHLWLRQQMAYRTTTIEMRG